MTDATAPERIWLQTDGDYAAAHEAALGTETGVTWCDHSVNEDDTEYVRADLARARVAAAYEAAAREVMCGCAEASSEAIQSAVTGTDFARACPNLGINCAMRDAAAIVALTPADARAALDRLLAEARAQEREACAARLEQAATVEEATAMKHASDPRQCGKYLHAAKQLHIAAVVIRARGAAQEGNT